MEELQKEIERIRREQEELVFGAFDEQTAWETGNRLRQIAREKGYVKQGETLYIDVAG